MSQGCVCKKCRVYVIRDNPDYGYCERCGDTLESRLAEKEREIERYREALKRIGRRRESSWLW